MFVFYIFVDEDWKNKLLVTNILWGTNLKDKSTLKLRPFDFSTKYKGIYIDKITDNVDWFKTNSNGGIFVGEIDFSTLKIQDQKELDATFIYIQ